MLLITKLRLEKRWTKNKLSFASEVQAGDISRIEAGKMVPFEPQITRIARALGVPHENRHTLLKEVRDDG